MKIEIKYSGSIINLPSQVADLAPSASKIDLQVIISLFGYFEYFSCFESCIPLLAEKLSVSEQDIMSSILFWGKNGVLSVEDSEEFDSMMITGAKTTPPTYTGKQVSKFVEKNKKMEALFYDCQSILGKDFNKHDHDNIIQLKQVYKFSDAYILLLLAHCVEIEKTNWAYIRKLALELYDLGVTTYAKLEKHFADRKNKNSLEYKIRKLFGIGKREFTKTERSVFEKWINEKISFDLIKLAYEITVDKTGKSSPRYAAKVIENWLASGIKTVSEAIKSNEEYKKKEQEKKTPSYGDADSFFEAALKRSYEDDDDEEDDK